jgi:hypothetical protein
MVLDTANTKPEYQKSFPAYWATTRSPTFTTAALINKS